MRTALARLLILLGLLTAFVVPTVGSDEIFVVQRQQATLSVDNYLGQIVAVDRFGQTVEVHPGSVENCPLCKRMIRLHREGRIANGQIQLGALSASELLDLETALRDFQPWKPDPADPFAPTRENILAILRNQRKIKEQEEGELREKQEEKARVARELALARAEEAARAAEERERDKFRSLTSKLGAKGIEYIVFDQGATGARLRGATLVVGGTVDPAAAGACVTAVAECPEPLRSDLLRIAADWSHVTETRLRYATQILKAPSVRVEVVGGNFRLLHPKGEAFLELTALNIPKLPEVWKSLNGPWLVERASLTGEQLKKLSAQLRELANENKIQTPVLIQSDRSRERLAYLPAWDKAKLVIDDASLKNGDGDTPLFLPWLLDLATSTMPDRKIVLLFGHDERKPDSALSRWTKLAEDKEFEGAHVIFCICNDSPPELQKLADLALARGALSVVVATERINVPAMSFAASSFTKFPLPTDTTPVALWEACYTDALERLDRCLAIKNDPAAAAAILREFGDMGKYLLTPDMMGLKREIINSTVSHPTALVVNACGLCWSWTTFLYMRSRLSHSRWKTGIEAQDEFAGHFWGGKCLCTTVARSSWQPTSYIDP